MSTHGQREEWSGLVKNWYGLTWQKVAILELLDDVARLERERDEALRHLRAVLDFVDAETPTSGAVLTKFINALADARAFLVAHDAKKETR